jgi:hypothetical protein
VEATLAELEGTAAVNVLGGEVSVSGSVSVVIGAHADVGLKDGVFKVDTGVSMGVGVSVGLEVDVGGMVGYCLQRGRISMEWLKGRMEYSCKLVLMKYG